MAAGTIKTKGQLTTDIDSIIVEGGNIDALDLNGILQNIVASYEDIIRDYTTVQRDALTPVESQIIYNTTSNRLEYYSASMWLPCSQKETIAVDCSANPNYPEALCGDQYIVTVAGKIGGGSGADVHVGDLVTCTVANAGGTQASVGSSWKVTHGEEKTVSYRDIQLSFETGFQGESFLYFKNSVTITDIFVVVEKALSGTNDGELTFYGDSLALMEGSNLTSGVMTIPASSIKTYNKYSTVTGNGLIIDNEVMQISVSKTTVGGVVTVQVGFIEN